MRILIAGAGEVGFHLAKDLAMEGQDVVLIDPDRHHLEHASNTLDIQTVEGDATAIYITDHVKNAKVSRISYGIPIGGELEYVDGTTIARAIEGRVEINVD